jgi:imidazolonepropionase-like amidohydrolase
LRRLLGPWSLTSRAAHVRGLGHRNGRLAAGYDGDLFALKGQPVDGPLSPSTGGAVYAAGERAGYFCGINR